MQRKLITTKKISWAPKLGLLFFVMGLLFFGLGIQPSQAALTNLYDKATSSTLAAYEWNNLLSDFVIKNNGGDRLDGYFSINMATSSAYALDINGALRATNLTGAMSGTLNAGNVSTGAFGLNTGGGNYNFPANIGIGIGTATPASIITLANNRWVSALNSAGTGYVNMFRVNANDEIEVGGALNIGQFQFAADSGFNTFVDMPVTNASAAGTIMGYTMKVDGDNILNVYSEANGSGGIQNRRIGIGTSTPAFTLDVNGIINASALYVNGAPYIGSQWTTNGTSVYYNTGNVGIGTSTPIATLDVNGLIKMRTALITANEDVINKGYLDSALASTTAQIITQVATSSFWQGSMAGSIYNANSGSVGIGTTNPSGKLHITDASNTTRYASFGSTGLLTINFQDSAGSIPFLTLQNPYGNMGVSSHILFKSGYTGTTYIDSGRITLGHEVDWTSTAATRDSYLALFTSLDGALGEKLRITSAGNIGIGTTNPSQKLTIASGNIYLQDTYGITWSNGSESIWGLGSAGGYSLQFNTYNGVANTEKMRITGAGNVGIGTTTPDTRLTVIGSGSYSINAGNYRIGNVAAPTSPLDAVNKSYLDSAVGTAQSAFWNLDGSNLYASSTSWNIGIGTTNPGAKLDVAGSLRVTSAQVSLLSGSGQSFIMADSEGNLFATSSTVAANLLPEALYVGSTASTYTGNNNGNAGYAAAHAICENEYPGSRVCSSIDMLNSVRYGTVMPDTNVWVLFGPPGYPASANDCNARSINSGGANYGAYWEGVTTSFPKGRGLLLACNNSIKIACCQ